MILGACFFVYLIDVLGAQCFQGIQKEFIGNKWVNFKRNDNLLEVNEKLKYDEICSKSVKIGEEENSNKFSW